MYQLNCTVGENDLQPIYDHVHHADTLRLLERARLAFMAEIGAPSDGLIHDGIFPVITRIDISYKREIFSGPLVVTCERFIVNGKAFQMHQRIINQRGKTAVEAMVESMFMSKTVKRAVAVPEKIASMLRGPL